MTQWIFLIAGFLFVPGWNPDRSQAAPASAKSQLLFVAKMKQERNADNSTRGGDLLHSYTQVERNEGQVFDPVSGIFTVPVDGIYLLNGRFTISCYQCRTPEYLHMPVSFSVTLMKNNRSTPDAFYFPVAYKGVDSNHPNTRSYEFNVLHRLKAGDKMSLKYQSRKCGEGKAPLLYEATFSGVQVY